MQYYQFHIGDYRADTAHLSPMEDLAYRRLLDEYYKTEEPIPTDIPAVSRRLRMEEEVVESVLNEFFEWTDDGWQNDRCNADIEAFHAYIDKQSANGKKGGRPRKKAKKTHRLPIDNPPQSQTKAKKSLPSTHNPVPITHKEGETRVSRYPHTFKRLSLIDGIGASKAQGLIGSIAAEDEPLTDDQCMRALDFYDNLDGERKFYPITKAGSVSDTFRRLLTDKPQAGQRATGQPLQTVRNMPTPEEYAAGESYPNELLGEDFVKETASL